MADILEGARDDVLEALEPFMQGSGGGADQPALLDAIGLAIAQKRNEAKEARKNSGIEQVWTKAEEAYIGIDDANREDFQNQRWAKPMAMDGPVETGNKKTQHVPQRSSVYVRLTARYVDAGYAKLAEILLPADDKAFSFTETPVPELIEALNDHRQVLHDGMGNAPLMRPLKPGETPPPAPAPNAQPPTTAGQGSLAPGLSAVMAGMNAAPQPAATDMRAGLPTSPLPAPPPMVPLTVKDLAEEAIEMARKKAKKAETRIYDWMVESQYAAEVRKVIFDAARLGVGILKAPTPKASRGIAVRKEGKNGVQIEIERKIAPAAMWADPWNIFPDPSCGEDIHEGDFIFERDYLSPRQVRELKKLPGYIASAIDKVLEEGPNKINSTGNGESSSGGPNAKMRKDRFEVWYYYGSLTRDELSCVCAAAGKPLTDHDVPASQPHVFVIGTLINDTMIRATPAPLESGAFPYHAFTWQRRAGSWAGIGVGEQIDMPQRLVNAATRAMSDNAGKSAGSQVVLDQKGIRPADGNWTITPDKVWYKTGDSQGDDVRKAFVIFDIPNHTSPLMSIINYGMQLAEEVTSIPLVTQGRAGETTPDTLGATQIQDSNANQLLRTIGYSFDDCITEPVVRQFYEWLLLDPDVPDDEKGDFHINAHGSVALVERAIMDQTIQQILPLSLNNAYGLDPKRCMKQTLKSKRLDPEDFQYSQQELDAQAKNPPLPPAAQVAQIRTASAEKIAAGSQANDAKEVEVRHQEALAEATVALRELELKKELAMLEYANREKISIGQVKADLAQTAMKLNTQRELNAADNAVDLHKHRGKSAAARKPTQALTPPTQAPGRAGNGRAFEQGPSK